MAILVRSQGLSQLDASTMWQSWHEIRRRHGAGRARDQAVRCLAEVPKQLDTVAEIVLHVKAADHSLAPLPSAEETRAGAKEEGVHHLGGGPVRPSAFEH